MSTTDGEAGAGAASCLCCQPTLRSADRRITSELSRRAMLAGAASVLAGLGFVVSVFASVTNRPCGRFVMFGANPRVKQVFDVTRLSEIIPCAPDLKGAVARFNDGLQRERSGDARDLPELSSTLSLWARFDPMIDPVIDFTGLPYADDGNFSSVSMVVSGRRWSSSLTTIVFFPCFSSTGTISSFR